MSGSTDKIVQQQTVGDTATGWSQALPFSQFDPALGTLQAIDVGLTADLTGGVSVESLEAAPATISVSQTGNVSVASPTGASLVSAPPEASASAGFGAYDGATDYAGASGATFALSNAATADLSLPAGTIDLGPFLGTRTVALPVAANAALHANGPANLQLLSHASAGAVVDLQYDHSGSGGANQGGGAVGSILTTGGGWASILPTPSPPRRRPSASGTAPQDGATASQRTGSTQRSGRWRRSTSCSRATFRLA
jgi:hypothetical protein